MSSAVPKIEADDILAVAEATVAGFSAAAFETAVNSLGRLQQAARVVKDADNRQQAVSDLIAALREIEAMVRPIGQSVARSISAATLDLVRERDEEIVARDPATMNAVEMHVASLIMALRRRLISGRMPVASALLANLTALRQQLPQARSHSAQLTSVQRGEFIEKEEDSDPDAVPVQMEPGRLSQIRSWSERLAGRLMGRR